jgi:ribonuclease HI
MSKYDKLLIHVDGGCRGNPGPGAIAFVIEDDEGNGVEEHSEFIGETTNNRAEYAAVIAALEMAHQLCKGEVSIFSDSKLVVNQLSGSWKIGDKELKTLFEDAKKSESSFEKVTYTHVRRENNKRADELVNETLDNKLKF